MDIIRRKPIIRSGTSREDIRAFTDQARQRAGRELARVQEGLQPTDFIYVFHAFQKKSRKTSKDDIRLARYRYRTMLRERKTR